MAYLDNTTITVDAILTKKGRERLASGGKSVNGFHITQFSLADDEIDYSLWDPTHPNGSAFYGSVIENTPLLEAVSDETQIMKSKLLTLPKGTPKVPLIDVGVDLGSTGMITLTVSQNTEFTLSPVTANIAGADQTLGYTFILHNGQFASLSVVEGVDANLVGTVPSFLGDITQQYTISEVGKVMKLNPKNLIASTNKFTKITIIGNETGAQKTLDIKVVPQAENTNAAG
tara:strand:+ start:5313 stop:6002 length:690 start_codon:yes stop_codon:yes gene_type:complete